MGAYIPDPIAVVALKTTLYGAYAWLVTTQAQTPRNPIVFALLRVGTGWVVGAAALLVLAPIAALLGGGAGVVLAGMTLPRAALWWLLIEHYFRPRGGKRTLLWWTLGGVALSTATDLLIFYWFPTVPALRHGWC